MLRTAPRAAGGPGGLVCTPRKTLCTPRRTERGEPAAVRGPGLRCREPGGRGELGDLVRADVCPREPRADLSGRPQPDLLQPQRRPRRLDLDQGLAQRAEEL